MQAPYTFNEKHSLLSQDELQNELDKIIPCVTEWKMPV